jgi:hypothetical protein
MEQSMYQAIQDARSKAEKKEIESRRRAFCIEQAVMLDDAAQDNVNEIADQIYQYVFGNEK